MADMSLKGKLESEPVLEGSPDVSNKHSCPQQVVDQRPDKEPQLSAVASSSNEL